MLKKIRLLFLSIIIFQFLTFQIFADSKNFDIEEYVLENGMHIYVLEDFSCALVRIELSVAAGFSKQTPQNAGFFPLYSKLFKYTALDYKSELSELYSECNSDASRYVINVTPNELRTTLSAFSKAAFDPTFTDLDISRELENEKKQVSENASSVEGFINSSIDSRVFQENPWKHDSGIYPSLFSKTNIASCRTFLTSISEKYYKPKNCALFISGPITKEQALILAQESFGKKIETTSFDSFENDNDDLKILKREETQKKLFVLSDPEFSKDMTQLVIQYTGFEMDECDFTACILNQDNSSAKNILLSNNVLGIRANEYINFASTHKNNCSRLIIQALMENQNVSPCDATLEFISSFKKLIPDISENEFLKASDLIENSFEEMQSDSSKMMEMLSMFWAVKDFSRSRTFESDFLVNNFFERPTRILNTSFEKIKTNLEQEEPFVFVLVNSSILKKYEKQFEKNGFEIVTKKNGSWYTQELFATIKKSIENKSDNLNFKNSNLEFENLENLFFEKNLGSIKQFSLKNGIPIYIKENHNSSTVSFCLMIDGGEVCDEQKDYGLESVLVKSIALKIQNSLYKKYLESKIKTLPEVQSATELTSSVIYLECLASDLTQIIESFSDALIFSDFIPSLVDSVVLQRKSEQIVKTSSPVYQLYSNAISLLVKNKEVTQTCTLEQDILQKINFTKILESTTSLFNAGKYKIIICGNTNGFFDYPNDLIPLLQYNFNLLSPTGKIEKPILDFNNPTRKTRRIKLVHLFLTDVSKEKAGPRPQVLIPTTEFLDPAQYWFEDKTSLDKQILFNALLFDFADYLQTEFYKNTLTKEMIVRFDSANENINFVQLTILNVKSSSYLEQIFQNSFNEYILNLNDLKIKEIKNRWIKKNFSDIQENSKTALLIADGLDSKSPKPEKYLQDYQKLFNANLSDFEEIAKSINFEEVLKMYSQDTKR